MEEKTKFLATVFIAIAMVISLLTKSTSLISSENFPALYFYLNKIMTIAFLLASSLFIWRGIYFMKANGYRHVYLGSLALGTFIVIINMSTLFIQKEIGSSSLELFAVNLSSIDKNKWNELTAHKVYIWEGRILEYEGNVYKPTPEDVEIREELIQLRLKINRTLQCIEFWLGIVAISLLLGLFWPVKKLPNKSEETNQKTGAAF